MKLIKHKDHGYIAKNNPGKSSQEDSKIPENNRAESGRAKVLDYFTTNPDAKISRAASDLGFSSSYVSLKRSELIQQGLMQRKKPGHNFNSTSRIENSIKKNMQSLYRCLVKLSETDRDKGNTESSLAYEKSASLLLLAAGLSEV